MFICNLDGAPAARNDRSGLWTDLEQDAQFEDYGINVHVIQPGQANAMYHAENRQEDFLVLHGECIAIIEDTEHRLRTWDFVHCPRGTRHTFVGAGDGPCAILMVGARPSDAEYPRSDVAARYGAAATDPEEPYAGFPQSRADRFSWPPEG
ncbi:MAG TPA: cupin domain-containing protein [Solirubrobacteraceae bacterium]|nr:cupin domain-containing protein [Solirubrobacteraceae bacterium]